MEPWYSGAVVDAVREAKTRRAILLVYVRDTSDQSQATDQLWSTVWTKLDDTTRIVALRLDKDTQPALQFMAIYKVQNYPTIYFINGQNGQVLKMIDQNIENSDQLEQSIQDALKVVDSPATAAVAAATPAPTTVPDAGEPVKTVEEKVAQARARLRELQEKREDEAKEKEKQDEIDRRRLGQQILLDKQKKDEELIRQQAEEIRRDRLEQQKLQEKLKQQIQQDREEKRRQYEQNQAVAAAATATKASESKAAATAPTTIYKTSRLQFRLTDGSFFTGEFSSDAHMNDVYNYLDQNLSTDQYRHGSYFVRTIHTRLSLTRDNPSTLKELELVPSAVLLVIQRGSNVAPSAPTGNLPLAHVFQPISLFFTWLMMQLNFLYRLISTKLFGATPTRATSSSSSAAAPNQRRPPRGNFPTDSTESSTIRRFRNTQDDDDDEEKRTWNGNSTQQM